MDAAGQHARLNTLYMFANRKLFPCSFVSEIIKNVQNIWLIAIWNYETVVSSTTTITAPSSSANFFGTHAA